MNQAKEQVFRVEERLNASAKLATVATMVTISAVKGPGTSLSDLFKSSPAEVLLNTQDELHAQMTNDNSESETSSGAAWSSTTTTTSSSSETTNDTSRFKDLFSHINQAVEKINPEESLNQVNLHIEGLKYHLGQFASEMKGKEDEFVKNVGDYMEPHIKTLAKFDARVDMDKETLKNSLEKAKNNSEEFQQLLEAQGIKISEELSKEGVEARRKIMEQVVGKVVESATESTNEHLKAMKDLSLEDLKDGQYKESLLKVEETMNKLKENHEKVISLKPGIKNLGRSIDGARKNLEDLKAKSGK